jgi:hypothetical protein
MGRGRKPTRKGGRVTAVVFCAVLVGGLQGVSFAADGTPVDASSDPADAATAATTTATTAATTTANSTVGAAAAQSTATANTATNVATDTANTATNAATNTINNTTNTATNAAGNAVNNVTNTAGNAVDNATNTAGNAVNHGAGSVGPASNSGGTSTATEGSVPSGPNGSTSGGRVHDSSGGNASASHDAPERSRSSAGGVVMRRLRAPKSVRDAGDISTLVAAIDQVSASVGEPPAVAPAEGNDPLPGWFFGLLPYTGVALFGVLATSLILILQGIGMVGFGQRRRQRSDPVYAPTYTR